MKEYIFYVYNLLSVFDKVPNELHVFHKLPLWSVVCSCASWFLLFLVFTDKSVPQGFPPLLYIFNYGQKYTVADYSIHVHVVSKLTIPVLSRISAIAFQAFSFLRAILKSALFTLYKHG